MNYRLKSHAKRPCWLVTLRSVAFLTVLADFRLPERDFDDFHDFAYPVSGLSPSKATKSLKTG